MKNLMLIPIFLISLVFIAGCQNAKLTDNVECTKDSDCSIGGCSGQLCIAKESEDAITTCEYSPVYECYKLTDCNCINNKCIWKENEVFNNCLKNEGNL